MTDYETLYNQSQSVVQKQKEQIKRLEEEIRERCQSYLIHSSRYRAKQPSSAKKSDDQQDLEAARLRLISRTVHTKVEASQTEDEDIGGAKVGSMTGSFRSERNGNVMTTPNKIQTSNSAILPQEVPMSPIELVQSINGSETKSENLSALKQSAEVNNWEEVINGFKDRLSETQKQKSEQTKRVLELEEELKRMKKQQRALEQSSMKKKPRSYALEESQTLERNLFANGDIHQGEGQLDALWEAFKDRVSLEGQSLAEKVKAIVNYVQGLKKNEGNLDESKVSSYNFSTPYRGKEDEARRGKGEDKKDQEESRNLKDVYEAEEIQLLKKKCKELEAELSVSRVKRQDSSPRQNREEVEEEDDDDEEIVHESPYLIEEELEKPNNEYIKRTFVRKKVVKRNLTAMILKSSTKSKKERRESMQSQLDNLKEHLQRSKDGKNDKEINTLNRKISKLEQTLKVPEPQIDEMSEESSVRASGISESDLFTEIIQVETQGPGYKNYTAHILGLQKKDHSTHEGKKN